MKYISQNTGFSLLEIIIVVVIIGIMAAVFVPGQLKNREKKTLALETERVANDIRSARSCTFNATSFNGGGPPSGGFGIHFDENSSTYFIFADEDNTQVYESINANGIDEKYRETILAEDIEITDLKIGAATPSSADIVFTSPYGVTYINDDNTAGRKLEITVAGSAGSNVITVDVSGRID